MPGAWLDGSLTLAWVLGPTEIIIIGGVALLLFGKRLPEIARSAGKAVVSFKKGLREVEEDIDSVGDEDETGSGDDNPPKTDADKDQT